MRMINRQPPVPALLQSAPLDATTSWGDNPGLAAWAESGDLSGREVSAWTHGARRVLNTPEPFRLITKGMSGAWSGSPFVGEGVAPVFDS